MLNEAHDGLRRCIRTRCLGKDILASAHQAGVRFLAMEALYPEFTDACNISRELPDWVGTGYLHQPEMRELICGALNFGWTLIGYEAKESGKRRPPSSDHTSIQYINWREEEQARNLIEALEPLPTETKMLVWCGNGHHGKVSCEDWLPMGYQFSKLSGIDPFSIDQTVTVRFDEDSTFQDDLVKRFADELDRGGRGRGFLRDEGPEELAHFNSMDAYILSLDNELE